MTDIKTICKLINNIVEKRGYTVYKIAKESGLQRNQVKIILGGSGNYTVDSLLKIAEALEISIELKEKT